MRAKNKALKEAEEAKKMLAHNLADSTTKLQEARNKGVKMDAEMIRYSKMEDKIDEISEEESWEKVKRKGGKKERKTEKCKFFESYSSCNYSDEECYNIHPRTVCKSYRDKGKCEKGNKCIERHAIEKKESGGKDCPFYLKGRCMFNSESCRFYHDSKKYGMKKSSGNDRKRTMSLGNSSPRRSTEGILKSPGRGRFYSQSKNKNKSSKKSKSSF